MKVKVSVGSGRGAGAKDLIRGTDVRHAFLQHFMCRAPRAYQINSLTAGRRAKKIPLQRASSLSEEEKVMDVDGGRYGGLMLIQQHHFRFESQIFGLESQLIYEVNALCARREG